MCTKQAASPVYSVLRSAKVQNILCWLACFVHNGPPSPKFQILPSQLRLTADRAVGLHKKSLGGVIIEVKVCTSVLRSTVHSSMGGGGGGVQKEVKGVLCTAEDCCYSSAD